MVINPRVRKPNEKVPCSVEDCTNHVKAGCYQVIGVTQLGNKAIRIVAHFCWIHWKEWEQS